MQFSVDLAVDLDQTVGGNAPDNLKTFRDDSSVQLLRRKHGRLLTPKT
jgi:hypothetical protein